MVSIVVCKNNQTINYQRRHRQRGVILNHNIVYKDMFVRQGLMETRCSQID